MKKLGVEFLSFNFCGKLNSIFGVVQGFLFKKRIRDEVDLQSTYVLEDTKCGANLLEEIEEVKIMLEQANMEFNSQTNSDLIESCIYNIEALEKKYNYLIKEARRQKIRCDAKPICVIG